MNKKLEEILYLPRPESKRHPKMPMDSRAAQFLAFAALTGYEEVIEETAQKHDIAL